MYRLRLTHSLQAAVLCLVVGAVSRPCAAQEQVQPRFAAITNEGATLSISFVATARVTPGFSGELDGRVRAVYGVDVDATFGELAHRGNQPQHSASSKLVPVRLSAQSPVRPGQGRAARTGLKGAFIGAAIGTAAAAFFAYSVCDAENCWTHPDTYKITAGGLALGAVVGYVTGRVIDSNRDH